MWPCFAAWAKRSNMSAERARCTRIGADLPQSMTLITCAITRLTEQLTGLGCRAPVCADGTAHTVNKHDVQQRSPTCGGVAFRACRKCNTHALAAHDSQYPAMLTEALNGTWTTTPCYNVTDCGQSHSNQTSQYVPNRHIPPAQSSSRSQPCAHCCRNCYRCCLERPPPDTLITKPQTSEPPPAQTPLPLAPALTASPHTFHIASQQVASQPPEKPSRTPPQGCVHSATI